MRGFVFYSIFAGLSISIMFLFTALLPTFVNTLAVLAGSSLGLLLHGRFAPRFRTILFQAIGLSTLIIGLRDALRTQDVLFLALSMIAGGLVGEGINIEARLAGLGEALRRRLGKEDDDTQFIDGFVFASLLFCIGAMTVVGSFRAGVTGDGEILYTKSLLDGHASIFIAGAMGAGVMASAGSVFAVQATLTLLFMAFGGSLPDYVLTEVGAAGGLLIIGVSINILELGKIRLGNLLPSMLFAGILAWIKHGGL